MTRALIPLAGVVTFAAVYALLQLGLQAAAPSPLPASPMAANDSLARRIGDGHVAVALPVTGAQSLVVGLPHGTRLDVLASVLDAETGRPLTAVVARGATLVQQVNSTDPMLVSVQPPDALVLAHLVLGGTPLTYTVWSGGVPPQESAPLDERTARALLGLPVPSPTVAPAAPEPTAVPATPRPLPTATPPPSVSAPADRYVVQPGDTLSGIAAQLGIPLDRMHEANPDVPTDGELPPGMQLVVPQ